MHFKESLMRKMVISGASGMIGSTIARIALGQGYTVCCIVRKDSDRRGNLPISDKLTIVEAELKNYATLTLTETYDCFLHLAWDKTFGASRDNVDTQLNNIQFTLDAVRLAKRSKCSVFVGAGSQAEYGRMSVPLKPDMPVSPESGYGIAKYTAGRLSRMLCQQLGMRQNWVRIVSTYGINDAPHTLISYVIGELLNSKSPELTKCEQLWDYLYSDDAARAFIAVAEKGKDGVAYPLGSGKGLYLSEYVEKIKEAINPQIALEFGRKNYYDHQPMYLLADIDQLTRDTGWEPEIQFEDGIKRILASKEKKGYSRNEFNAELGGQ
jgi:UDP-glucose 4-epimerase